MKPDSEFEHRLQSMASTDVTPTPDRTALSTILARRARGERLALPMGNGPLLVGRDWMAAAAVVAVLLLTLVPYQENSHSMAPVSSDAPADGTAGDLALLLPASLMAQTTRTPRYSVVDEPLGLRLKPGRWFYLSARGEGAKISKDTLTVTAIERDSYRGQPAWRFLGGRSFSDGPLFTRDTTWTTRDSLRILARVVQIGPDARIEETYGDSTVLRGETHGGFTAWESRLIRNPDGPSGNGVAIRWYQFAAALQTAKLSADWKASIEFRGIIFDGEHARDYFNIAVVGEEVITVPAGRFDCWKVAIGGTTDPENNGLLFWVSKERGWIVAQRFANRGVVQLSMLLARVEELQ